MKQDRLRKLSQVTEALYQKEFAQVRDVLAQEARLRGALAKIREQSQSSTNNPTDLAMQSSGADLVWRAWADQKRRALNTELAQLLAQKSGIMGAARRAFGRNEAMKAVLDARKKTRT